jgi:hypothetical protein
MSRLDVKLTARREQGWAGKLDGGGVMAGQLDGGKRTEGQKEARNRRKIQQEAEG